MELNGNDSINQHNNNKIEVKNLVLFGTSADPPTIGHQTILRWLAQHYDLVVVWASDNPFKTHQASLSLRSRMLELIIQEIEPPRTNITLCQLISDRRSLITVRKARQIWSAERITLVIGADLVKQIVTWYQIEMLLQQVQILIVPRLGYSITEEDLQKLEYLGGKYTVATLNAPRVSSSIYRLRQDKTVLTPAVREYIESRKLYSRSR